MFKRTYGEGTKPRANVITGAVMTSLSLVDSVLTVLDNCVGPAVIRGLEKVLSQGGGFQPSWSDSVVKAQRRAYGFAGRPFAMRHARNSAERASAVLGVPVGYCDLGHYSCVDFTQFQVRSLAAQ